MPGPPTTNLGLSVPTVGADFGVWGNELNGNLAILDTLGAFPVQSMSASGTVTLGTFPETIVLATGGVAGIALVIPTAALNRIVTIKKVDSGVGSITISTLAGTIDSSATYILFNQFQYVRLLWTGTSWFIVGNN